jgi:dihydroorotase
MPNTQPAIDGGHLARYIRERGREVGLCEVVAAGSITAEGAGKTLAHLDELAEAGVTLFTDDGSTVEDSGLLRLAMEYLAERGAVLAQHAEDHSLARGGHMHEGAVSSLLGVKGIPALAEELVVARDLSLQALTGVRYHVQHVSSLGTLDLLRTARNGGADVTCEVTPHHLSFDESQVMTLDPVYKMYPPLRSAADRAALVGALAEGLIDAVATDHAPHAPFETEVPFSEAPRGVIGLETAASAIYSVCELPIEDFFARMSVRPAQIGRFARQGEPIAEGAFANLVIFDPRRQFTPEHFRSKSENSPFRGMPLQGMVVATLFSGRVTHLVAGVQA